VAGVAGVGLFVSSAVPASTGLSSGEIQKTKHNAGMALALSSSTRAGYVVMSGQRPSLSIGSVTAALPNTSVEATNCSKLQFAPHLER
jgi:hypothetical protein